MTGFRILTCVSLAALLFACSNELKQPVDLQAPGLPSAEGNVIAEFVGHVDVATGTIVFEPAAELGSQRQALGEVNVIQDGQTGTGPDESAELVTDQGSIIQPATPSCTGGSLDANVTVRSFYSVPLQDVYMELTRVTPTGRELCNSAPAVDGLSAAFGLVSYGTLDAKGGANAAVSKPWHFKLPTQDSFTFKGRLMATWCGNGVCDGTESCLSCNDCCISSARIADVSPIENAGSQVWVDGSVSGLSTPGAGQGAGVSAEIGYGAAGADPLTFTWIAASYLGDLNESDLYGASLTAPAAGSYDVRMRFTEDAKVIVTPAKPLQTFAPGSDIGYCNVQWPSTNPLDAIVPAGSNLNFYSRIWIGGVTDTTSEPAPGIYSQLGMGPSNDPRFDEGWKYVDGHANTGYDFNQSNDEHTATLVVPLGSNRYVWRYRRDAGWTYCDDISGAGTNSGLSFDPNLLYTMTGN